MARDEKQSSVMLRLAGMGVRVRFVVERAAEIAGSGQAGQVRLRVVCRAAARTPPARRHHVHQTKQMHTSVFKQSARLTAGEVAS